MSDEYGGFQSAKQLQMYSKFTAKAIELLSQQIYAHLEGVCFDIEAWSRKIIKLNKALNKMEESKSSEPLMSLGLSQLTELLRLRVRDKSNASPISTVNLALTEKQALFSHREFDATKIINESARE